MHDELQGRAALVTGASRGIGRAIAVALARAGADVAVNYRSCEQAAKETCAEIERLGRNVVAVAADVSVAAEVRRLVTTVEARLGSVTILVNNAGITRPQPIDAVTEQDWDEIVAVNLKSMFLVTQQILPGMRSQMGADHQSVVGCGSAGRGGRPSLCRVQSRCYRPDPLVRTPARQGRHNCQCHRAGLGRNGDGDEQSPRQTRSDPHRTVRDCGGDGRSCRHARPKWLHHRADFECEWRMVHELTLSAGGAEMWPVAWPSLVHTQSSRLRPRAVCS